ncbi:MAG: hypothetical protein E7139_03775 [Rikenellaceae bacterium]|nr:hypothetical protein [Rikenellaceae bacterium]
MKKIIFLAIASLLAVTATAQQLKTAQGITTITTIEKPKKPKEPKKTLAPIERGFEQSVEVGVNNNLEWNGDDFLSAEYIAGYRFNDILFIGGGTGLESFLQDHTLAISIYANARLYLLSKSRWQPFISLSLGGSVRIAEGDYYRYNDIQPHINPTVGINYRINSKYSCYLNLGYIPRWIDDDSKGRYNYNLDCLTIRLGFTF